MKVDLDREKARKLGVPINEVFQALSASMGGSYVNDFNRFGRLFRVYVQSEADYRRKPKDIGDIYVRSRTTNTMIPLSTLINITSEGGTEITVRFNLFRSVEINGVSGPRLYFRPVPGCAGGGLQADDAKGDGLRLFQSFLSGKSRAAGGTDLRSRHRFRVSPAGRYV